MEINIVKYTPELSHLWNNFIINSKNGLFLFDRNYMDYHSDRFKDNSLLFYNGDELLALLPANDKDGVLYSHGGLTYGGFVTNKRMSTVAMIHIFDALKIYCIQQGIKEIYYKAVPYYYHRLPAQEDLYALFRNEAVLYRRDASSIINLTNRLVYAKGTKASLSKGRKAGLRIVESQNYALFMAIEEEILQKKYGTKPTHTVDEIEMLANRFPENIRLFMIYMQEECVGGTIIFQTAEVIHTQYIGITEKGRLHGALDTLVDYLLNNICSDKKYFSFGISTEQSGQYLNEGLMRNKESFGARTIVLDFYKLIF